MQSNVQSIAQCIIQTGHHQVILLFGLQRNRDDILRYTRNDALQGRWLGIICGYGWFLFLWWRFLVMWQKSNNITSTESMRWKCNLACPTCFQVDQTLKSISVQVGMRKIRYILFGENKEDVLNRTMKCVCAFQVNKININSMFLLNIITDNKVSYHWAWWQ